MSETEGAIIFTTVSIVIGFAVYILCWQNLAVTDKQIQEAYTSCARGIEKIYVDGDYRCKK